MQEEPKHFTLRVFRYDPDQDAGPRYQDYRVPQLAGMTVLQALVWVLDHLDHSLAFRYSCREAICGSDAYYISGAYHLACRHAALSRGTADACAGGIHTIFTLAWCHGVRSHPGGGAP